MKEEVRKADTCSALYAHRINTNFWNNVDQGESFGFGKGQVTPFNLSTVDGETLYAWHVLPLNIYADHQQALQEASARGSGPVADYRKTLPFQLLSQDPNARVVISCEFLSHSIHVLDYKPD